MAPPERLPLSTIRFPERSSCSTPRRTGAVRVVSSPPSWPSSTTIITAKNARNTAFHEAGHALVAVLTDGANQIHKATIMPRGDALGMVTQLPSGDQTSQSCKEMHAYMDICYAGRVAEELVFGKENITSGASSDIMQATRTARAMVTKYGFSDEIGIQEINITSISESHELAQEICQRTSSAGRNTYGI